MPARRQFGRIRKLPSGRYQARLPGGEPAPQTFPTKADASRWLATAETDAIRGALNAPVRSGLTVAAWVDEWHRDRSVHKRPGTRAREASAIRCHIKPLLGGRLIADLRPLDLQQFVAAVAADVGPGTTHAVYAVVRAALNDAAELELLSRSPARGVKLPPIPSTDVLTLRVNEIHALASAVEEPWRPMVYVAATCGLRFSEVVGLRRGRVDVEERVLHVITTAPQRDTDRAEPKSRAGRRGVPLSSFVAEILDRHLRSTSGADDDLLFRARRGGRIYAPNWHRWVWAPARKTADFPMLRFHDLRHSAVPLWISMGANLLQVSRWLGHSSVQITADVYGHLFPETNELVIGRLDRALRGALPKASHNRASS